MTISRILSVLWLCASCSLIPLQANRVDIVLHYRQTYELEDVRKLDPTGQLLGPRLLAAALGKRNYCSLSPALRTEYQSGLLATEKDRWMVDGLATAVVSPSPWWTDGFAFEAHGRYLIRSEEKEKIVATSDFYIERQSMTDIKDLFAGSPEHRNDGNDIRWIDLLINQTIIREIDLKKAPEDRRFVHESQAVLRIYLLLLKSEGVFMIAPMKHEIGIVSPREKDKVYSVGCVEFRDISDEPKIFDVRGRNSVWRTTDYPELLRRGGIHEHLESFRPHWYGQSCADDERRPQYQAGARRSAQEWRLDPEGKVFKRLFDEVDDSTCNGLPVSATHAWTGDWCL